MSSFRARLALRPRSVPRYSVPRAGVGGRLVRERAGDAGTSLVVREHPPAAHALHPVVRKRAVRLADDRLVGSAARDRRVGAGHPASRPV